MSRTMVFRSTPDLSFDVYSICGKYSQVEFRNGIDKRTLSKLLSHNFPEQEKGSTTERIETYEFIITSPKRESF